MKTIDEVLKNYEQIYHEHSASTVMTIDDIREAMKEYAQEVLKEIVQYQINDWVTPWVNNGLSGISINPDLVNKFNKEIL